MIDQTRRKLLKTIAYGTALSATVASSASIAFTTSENIVNDAIPAINIFQQQSDGKEIVSLMNLSNEAIILDKNTPVSLKNINNSLMVSLNAANESTGITVEAGERFAFEVETVANYAKLSSDHAAFNGVMSIAA
ncbi:MAG: hypothetical protein DSZ29_02425 [Aquificaceae bacterium]|nr:MAG: hypothetical protein DSZ29_02425 [Aquificaceae bacterium]